MFDLDIQGFICPGASVAAGRACFAHCASTCKQADAVERSPAGLHFVEAGQKVQRKGATLRETAAVATQWDGH
ncbi:hypothetical protein [Bradyrhizobium centrolobii]|uniref:hypothetical protein n=1 Tax=Bradyrhizobium centrolobii TaxID=1505087 RepID=UPI000AD4BBD7|nr:hypothetical protein [Bradyrhizobium centrolobii]